MEINFQSIVRSISKAHKFNTLRFSAYKESILTIEWLAHNNSLNESLTLYIMGTIYYGRHLSFPRTDTISSVP